VILFSTIPVPHNTYDSFGNKTSQSSSGNPLLSWRVHLLPYLGKAEATLYEKFKLDEPWNSQHNAALVNAMPVCFNDPYNRHKQITTANTTRYLANNPAQVGCDGGKASVFDVLEVPQSQAVTWTKPDSGTSPSFDTPDKDEDELLVLRNDGTVAPRKESSQAQKP
jgi:hypothetical protein